MLGESTVVRTPEGDRLVSELGTTATLFDSHNRPIEVDVGPPEPMGLAYEVFHYPLHSNQAARGRAGLRSFYINAEHPLLLVAPVYVQAIVQIPTRSETRKRVNWHTRCTGHLSIDAEIAEEAVRLAELREPVLLNADAEPRGAPEGPRRSRRPSTMSMEPMPASTPPNAPSSDPSWHSRDDDEVPSDDDGNEVNAEAGDDLSEEEQEDDHPQPAPSSDAWLEDPDYSVDLMNRLEARLQADSACRCGATRTISLTCETEAQAAHIRDALLSHLYPHVDPQALLAGDTHVLTAHQYVNSGHVRNPAAGAPAPGAYLKMGRFPFELLPAEGVAAQDMPLDPQWLGWWYGDGDHDRPGIAAAASDEAPIRAKCQAIVNHLNSRRPEGLDPVHLAVTIIPANDSGEVVSNQDCYTLRISGSARPGTHWNPYVDRMQALGIWANNKENGIPEIYKAASEEVRAAVLAGFIDTDSCLINNSNACTISQCVRHRRLVEDARAMAIGLGIKVGRLRTVWAVNPANDQEHFEQLAFGMFGARLAVLQPHIALARKRVYPSWIDSQLRALLLEEAAGPVMGRRIRLPGHELTTLTTPPPLRLVPTMRQRFAISAKRSSMT